MVHHRTLLEYIEENYPTLQQTLFSMKSRSFSEFNFMGAVADHIKHPNYAFVHPNDLPIYAKQFWSWGGLSPAIRTELESL